MGQRHPVGAQNADVATRQGHVLELRESLVALVVGEQHLAAPHRSVGSVTRTVEREPEHPLRSVHTVLGHRRRDVCVVVLHGVHWPTRRVAVCPRGRPVQRMCVGHEHFGFDAGQLPQVVLCRVEG